MISARLKMITHLNGSDIRGGKTVVEVRPKKSWLKNAFNNNPYEKEPLDPLIEKVVNYLQTIKYCTVRILRTTYKIPIHD